MGLIRCVRGWHLRALPTNLSFQPDDGLGSNGHPGAAAILINQKSGERTAGMGMGTCELNLGQKLLHLFPPAEEGAQRIWGRGNSENGESICGPRTQGVVLDGASGREDGGAEGLPAALCGGGERGGMETLASGGWRSLAGARQRNVGEILGGLTRIFLIFS